MNDTITYLTTAQLEAGLDHIRQSPKEEGVLLMIVRRPAVNSREAVDEGVLDLDRGRVGDNWLERGSGSTADGSAHPEMQLNVINARLLDLVAGDKERWQLAGDQLVVDLDLSEENLPPGTQLALGDAVIEVTEIPHRGCAKFVARFGADAMRFVNSPLGTELHLRGINARVVQGGVIRTGDAVRKSSEPRFVG